MCCLGTCIFVTWLLELDQDLLQWFGLGLYHLQCYVCVIFSICDATFWLLLCNLDSLHGKTDLFIERVHSKFVRKLPSSYHSKFPCTMIERRQFHTAIQIFKSLHRISPYYMTYLSFQRMQLVILVVLLIIHLFLECLPTMASEVFTTEKLFYGTLWSPLLLGLSLCRHFELAILILDFLCL